MLASCIRIIALRAGTAEILLSRHAFLFEPGIFDSRLTLTKTRYALAALAAFARLGSAAAESKPVELALGQVSSTVSALSEDHVRGQLAEALSAELAVLEPAGRLV